MMMFNTRETHISHLIYKKGRTGHSLLNIKSDGVSFLHRFFFNFVFFITSDDKRQRERVKKSEEKISIVDPDLLYTHHSNNEADLNRRKRPENV